MQSRVKSFCVCQAEKWKQPENSPVTVFNPLGWSKLASQALPRRLFASSTLKGTQYTMREMRISPVESKTMKWLWETSEKHRQETILAAFNFWHSAGNQTSRLQPWLPEVRDNFIIQLTDFISVTNGRKYTWNKNTFKKKKKSMKKNISHFSWDNPNNPQNTEAICAPTPQFDTNIP